MDISGFRASKADLTQKILNIMTEHFSANDVSFDRPAFKAESAGFLDLIVESAHFTGARILPTMASALTPEMAEAC